MKKLFLIVIIFLELIAIALVLLKIAETDETINVNVYATRKIETNFGFDEKNPNLVYEKATNVLKVKILGKSSSYFKEMNTSPVTPIKVKIIETLKGNIDEDQVYIFQYGGRVSLKQVYDNNTLEETINMGLYQVDMVNLEKDYMYYEISGNFNLEVGSIYVICLDSNNYLIANGYSIFEIRDEKFINPLTNSILNK